MKQGLKRISKSTTVYSSSPLLWNRAYTQTLPVIGLFKCEFSTAIQLPLRDVPAPLQNHGIDQVQRLEVYTPKIENKFTGSLLGHLADIKPWKDRQKVEERTFDFFEKWLEEAPNGVKTVQLNFAGKRTYVTEDNRIVRELQKSKDVRIDQTMPSVFKRVLPGNVIVAEGERWLQLRSLYVKALRSLDHDRLPSIVTNCITEAIEERSLQGQSFDVPVIQFFSRISLKIFFVFALGIEDVLGFKSGSGVLQDVDDLCNCISIATRTPLHLQWIDVYSSNERKMQGSIKRLRKYTDKFFLRRKQELEQILEEMNQNGEDSSMLKTNTLTDAFILAGIEASKDGSVSKKYCTLEVAADQVCGSLIAGYHTSPSTISLVLHELSKAPRVQEKLFEELKDLDLTQLTDEDLKSLTYLNDTISECTRIVPHAEVLSRQTMTDMSILDHSFPKDSTIFLFPKRMMKNPEYFGGQTDLHEFRPERWQEVQPSKGVCITFGLGARMCAGKRIAETFLRVVLAQLVQNYEIKPTENPAKHRNCLGKSLTPESELRFVPRKPKLHEQLNAANN